MALDIPLPRQILTHAHWTLGREKMAKSTGNVVNPFFALDRFGVETIRFYLAHDGGISHDADYGNEYIIERYKKALQGGLGNLTSRILRGKKWSVPRAVRRGVAGELLIGDDGPAFVQQSLLEGLPGRIAEKMDGFDVGGAVKEIMSVVYAVSWTCELRQIRDTDVSSRPTPLFSTRSRGTWRRGRMRGHKHSSTASCGYPLKRSA